MHGSLAARGTSWGRGLMLAALATCLVAFSEPISGPTERAPLERSLSSAVHEAIDLGVERLRRAYLPHSSSQRLDTEGEPGRFPLGYASMSLLAMLDGGLTRDDTAVVHGIAPVRSLPFERVYSVSTCILALDAFDAREDDARILEAGAWLVDQRNVKDGLWGYPAGVPDLSNSQYAVRAIEIAVGRGLDVGPKFWEDIIAATLVRQSASGGFGYRADVEPSGGMTAAAILILETAERRLEVLGKSLGARRRAAEVVAAAWSWLDLHFSVDGNPAGVGGELRARVVADGDVPAEHYAYLDALGRAADASGRVTIGGRDWARDGALAMLRRQRLDGGWMTLENTCFAVMFLGRVVRGAVSEWASPPDTMWRYTFDGPTNRAWNSVAFDDSTWSRGYGGFATAQHPDLDVRCSWPTGRRGLWLRREFTWRDGDPDPIFALTHSGPVTLYLNGVWAGRWREGTGGERALRSLSDDARRMLRDGLNVVALNATRADDAGYADIAFDWDAPRQSSSAVPWWRRAQGPQPDASFVRRWLVMGPVVDKRLERLNTPVLAEDRLAPSRGERSRFGAWNEKFAPGGFLDLAVVTKPGIDSLRYAFTWLQAERDTDVVLWIGSDDGVRVWLDGHPVHSHQRARPARPDEDAVPLHLTAGSHRLLFKVENRQHEFMTGLFVRITDASGEALRSVRPTLDSERPDWGAVALAHPELFSYSELHMLLAPARADRLDFAKSEIHDDGVALSPVNPRSPGWLPRGARPPGGDDPASGPRPGAVVSVPIGVPLPHPGAWGILELRPPARGTPAQMFRRVTLGRAISARICADGRSDPLQAGARFRVGYWEPGMAEGDVTWLASRIVRTEAEAVASEWVDFSVATPELTGRDVLVVLEAHSIPDRMGPDVLFIDELSFK